MSAANNLVAPDTQLCVHDLVTCTDEVLAPGKTIRLRLPGVNNYIEVKAYRDRPGFIDIRTSTNEMVVLPRGSNYVIIGCPEDAH